MALSINWATKVITVPQSFCTVISGSNYEFDLNSFRLALRDIEDAETGVVFEHTHNHNTAVTLAGATYARTVEVINGYTVTFEPTASPWTAVCVGANHNIGDVKNVNHVSLIVGNSAGLIEVATGGGSGLTAQQIRDAMGLSPTAPGSAGALSIDKLLRELHRLQGLESGDTVIVTDTTRKVNDGASDVIDQVIVDAGGTTTMERV